MRERYDAIVIGAGLSGLLTGAILARRGRRVVLLEQGADVGGRIRSYDVDRFVIDAGAYLWPNLHLDRALAAAGATGFRGSEIPPLQVMRLFVQGTGGERFAFPWPGRTESPAALAAAAAGLGVDAATFRALTRLWDRLAALSDAEVAALRHAPLREALPRFTSEPEVAQAFRRNVMLFGTYAPADASMAECIGLRRRPSGGPRPRPEVAGANAGGGVRALPQAIHAAFEAAGGELRLRHTVDQIVVEGGAVRGVLLHDASPFQQRVDAPVVVSSIPIERLFAVLAPTHFPPDFVANAARFAVVGGTISAAFAFDGLPRLRATGEEDAFPGWTRLLIGPAREFGGGFLWATLHSPHNAPAGKHVLQAMRLSPHQDLADAARVRSVHDAFRAMLDEIYLDVEPKLLWERRWINRDGSEYMITAAPRPPLEPPGVDGLYLVGESTEGGAVQMDNAALSAVRAADLIAPGELRTDARSASSGPS
jgi:phytoene dehydrogenase-like protein